MSDDERPSNDRPRGDDGRPPPLPDHLMALRRELLDAFVRLRTRQHRPRRRSQCQQWRNR